MNYYDILNVSKDATPAAIEQNFKKLMAKYGSNRSSDPIIDRKMKIIEGAYRTLSDPYSRGRYDAKLEGQFIYPLREIDDIFRNMVPSLTHLGTMRGPGIRSYSSGSYIRRDGDKTIKKESIITNKDGKVDKYYKKSIIDKDGHEKVVKEEGDKSLVGGNRHGHHYKLIRR